MAAEPSQPKSLILYAIWMTVLAVVLVWAAFLVRKVLLLIYVSGLLAIGFSPIVRLIERQKVLPIGTRIPRWLAILVLYRRDPRHAHGRRLHDRGRRCATRGSSCGRRFRTWPIAARIS